MPFATIEELLTLDAPAGRIALYLRLLYSSFSLDRAMDLVNSRPEELPDRTRDLLHHVDQQRLRVERSARLGALNRALSASLEPLYRVLALADGKRLLGAFADCADFWAGAGRSLGEGFAMFVARSPDVPEVTRGLARLAGVMSGLSADPHAPSPWPDAHKVFQPAGHGPILAEAFDASYALLREDGAFLDSADLDHGRVTAGNFRITVAIVDGDSCAVSCQPSS